MDRLTVIGALDELILREDGLGFQRLARRLLKAEFPDLVGHAEKADQGRDASFTRGTQRGILLASLTASWSKISGDLARARTFGPKIQLAIFCTPRTVSNEKVMRWKAQASEMGFDLEVRERAWVTDECLQPRNAILVIDELRITPPELQKGRADAPLAGEAFPVSCDPVSVGRTSAAMSDGRAIITWSEAPLQLASERIVLAVCEGDRIDRTILGAGADAQCSALAGDVYVCWMRRIDGAPLHTLSVWRESTGQVTEVAVVEELVAPPHLILWDAEPAVVYLAGGVAKPLVISALGIASGVASRLTVGAPGVFQYESSAINDRIDGRRVNVPAFSVRVGGLSVDHQRGCAIALVYGRFSGQLFVLTEKWRQIVAQWPFGTNVDTAEVALAGGHARCLTRLGSNAIYSGLADLRGRGWGSPVLVAVPGWHPDWARSSGRRFGAWVGAPPLPLGAQNESFAAGSRQRWIEVTQDLGDEALTHDARLRGADPRVAALHESPFASPQAPLWIGAFDERGRSLGEAENFGYLGRTARWPQIAFDSEGRGILLWECGDGDEVHLLARWLQA